MTTTLEFPYSRTLGPVVGEFFIGLRDQRLLACRTMRGRVLFPPLEYDPNTGDAWVSGGPVSGWVTHDIRSDTPPSASNLKGNLGDSSMRSTDIMQAYFGSGAQVLPGASNYHFTYKLNGVDYNQAG